MAQELELPKLPNLTYLLREADAHPDAGKIAGALLLSVATGIHAYKTAFEVAGTTEADRLTWAIEEASRHFMLLAATHGIK